MSAPAPRYTREERLRKALQLTLEYPLDEGMRAIAVAALGDATQETLYARERVERAIARGVSFAANEWDDAKGAEQMGRIILAALTPNEKPPRRSLSQVAADMPGSMLATATPRDDGKEGGK